MEKAINRLNLERFIKSLNGRFFTVKFLKRDGKTIRKMTARVLRIKAENRSDRPWTRNLAANTSIPVFDMAKLAYRSINLDTVMEIRANGKVFGITN